MKKTKKYSFTLIELIIVVAVIAFSLPVVFGLFFINLQAQVKLYLLQEVKRNGDYALNIMENIIKNRVYSIYGDSGLGYREICSTKSDNNTLSSYEYNSDDVLSKYIYFFDFNNNQFRFDIEPSSKRIASYSAVISPNPYFLTNNKVAISEFKIRCDRTSIFSPPIITVSFNVRSSGSSSRQEENVVLGYQKKIKLKNY